MVILDHKNNIRKCVFSFLKTGVGIKSLKKIQQIFFSELQHIVIPALDKGFISNNKWQFMLMVHPRVATFFTLTKIHKRVTPPKGRPIVSGADSLTQNVSIYVNHILQGFVRALPCYIRDTYNLIMKLEGILIDKGTKLTSIDVEALYSSMPHSWILKAIEYYLNTRGIQFREHNCFLLQFMEFIIPHSYFLFQSRIFQSAQGHCHGEPLRPHLCQLFPRLVGGDLCLL